MSANYSILFWNMSKGPKANLRNSKHQTLGENIPFKL